MKNALLSATKALIFFLAFSPRGDTHPAIAAVQDNAAADHQVLLTWNASASINVLGYNVYRGNTSGGPYARVNSALITTLSYTDTAAQGGQTYYYVATAIDSSNNESAFSNETVATVPNTIGSYFIVNPASGGGSLQNFTFTFSGAGFRQVHLLINSSLNATGGCYLMYQTYNDGLYTLDDAGVDMLGPMPAGSSGTLSNSQCSVALSGVSVSSSGSDVTLSIPVKFTPSFVGSKNIYMAAFDTSGNRYEWITVGSWTVTGPSGFTVTPFSGSGPVRNFTFTFAGVPLGQAHILVNSTLTGADSCYLMYQTYNNGLYMLDDTGIQLLGPVSPGSNATLSNSQCSVAASGVSVSPLGAGLTIVAPITFTQTFSGTRNIYMAAFSTSWNRVDWVTAGTWVVSGGSAFLATPALQDGSLQNFVFSF